MKIYTRTGDKGQTGLFSGKRVSKADPRVEAYGTVDEMNACLGLLRDHITTDSLSDVKDELLEQQKILFSLGAALADDRPDRAYRIDADATTALEQAIDRMNGFLPPMTHFILPGGSPAVSYAHLARTICRRAERRCVEVNDVHPDVMVYLNRLSDYLFVLARYVGMRGEVAEIKWIPGESN